MFRKRFSGRSTLSNGPVKTLLQRPPSMTMTVPRLKSTVPILPWQLAKYRLPHSGDSLQDTRNPQSAVSARRQGTKQEAVITNLSPKLFILIMMIFRKRFHPPCGWRSGGWQGEAGITYREINLRAAKMIGIFIIYAIYGPFSLSLLLSAPHGKGILISVHTE